MRNRGLARKAATAGAPASRRTLAVGNSEDNGNAVTEDKVKGKGKGKGRKEGDSKARAQDGPNGLDAQEEKGATSSAGYQRGRRGHQRTTRSAASAVETKIEDMDVSAESPPLDLTRYSYNGQPIVKMRIADLRDALRALGCGQDGKRLELLDRLANRLLKDSTGGNSGPVSADETSERGARYQKRRTRKTFTPLRKGHDTKECPITIASDDEAGADGRSEGGVSLAAGPKPGMTRAELMEAVKSLGLKPRGARKVDLEACWHEAVKSRAKEKSSEGDEGQDARQGKGHGDWGGKKEDKEAQPSVAGVPIMTMTVAALRKHVRGMGLKPSGRLKADLQRCLWDHLAEISEGRADPVEAIALSPNCMLFRGIPVADMEPDTMRGIMKELDVPVSRKSAKEARHDLVEALVLRRAEALETRPTKQRWRGRLVYKMRKMEVTNALHHFGADESGKVEAMRSRFRQLLRDWAARDVVITESGDGVAMEVNNANETGRVSQTGKPENPTLTAQPEDGSQLADCLELAGGEEAECEDRPPELAAQPQHESQGMDCSSEGGEAEVDTDTVGEVDADEEAGEKIEWRGVDEEEVKVESTKDSSGVECVSQTVNPEDRSPEPAAQRQDGSQLTDCLADEAEVDTDTVGEVDADEEAGEKIEWRGVDEEEVKVESTKDSSGVECVSQTVNPEDRSPEPAAQRQDGSQLTDCLADEAEVDTDTVGEVDADEEAGEKIEWRGVDEEEVKIESTKDSIGVECVSQTVNPEDRSPEPAAQRQNGSQLTDCLADEAECDTDTVEKMDVDGEAREEDEEVVESHVVDGQGQEVEAEGMEDTSGAECVWAGEEGREAEEGEYKEQDIDGDEDEDGYDNERALEGHVDEEEAESWEDEEGGDGERILDYGDEGVDEGASEYEDEEGEGTDEGEGEGEGEEEGEGMAMTMTGDTEEAAIDLAESDEEVRYIRVLGTTVLERYTNVLVACAL